MPLKRSVTNDDLARMIDDLASMIKEGFDQTATKTDVIALRKQLDTQGRVLADVHETVKEHTQELREIKATQDVHTAALDDLARAKKRDQALAKHLGLDPRKLGAAA